MSVTLDPQRREIVEHDFRFGGIQRAHESIPAQHVNRFDVEKMGGVQCISEREQTRFDDWGGLRAHYDIEDRRGIDHDQRLSLSSLRISTIDKDESKGSRVAKRARISSRVGFSAEFLISPRTYSDKDFPASAARDLSVRCNSSGTLRIWIITDMRT